MKHLLTQFTSPAKNHELVRLHLDVGQCRFIYKLVSIEYQRMLNTGINDVNDAVSQLLDNLENHAFPKLSTPFHRDPSLDDYIETQDANQLRQFLSNIYVEGSFCHV